MKRETTNAPAKLRAAIKLDEWLILARSVVPSGSRRSG